MKYAASIVTIWLTLSPAAAQDQARQIWDDYFGSARPVPPSGKPAQKPRYQPAAAATGGAASQRPVPARSAALGITVWKLEPPVKEDAARLLIPDTAGTSSGVPYTPHRLRANEPLKPGDRVRLSIEAPSEGFVYIIGSSIVMTSSNSRPPLMSDKCSITCIESL